MFVWILLHFMSYLTRKKRHALTTLAQPLFTWFLLLLLRKKQLLIVFHPKIYFTYFRMNWFWISFFFVFSSIRNRWFIADAKKVKKWNVPLNPSEVLLWLPRAAISKESTRIPKMTPENVPCITIYSLALWSSRDQTADQIEKVFFFFKFYLRLYVSDIIIFFYVK